VLPAKAKKPAGVCAGGLCLIPIMAVLVQAIAVRRHGHRMMVVMTMMEAALHLELRL
jgi:hypothetical protein